MKHLQLYEEYKNSNFLKWFGDSKVVDKDGKPLVVYHGTHKGFDEFIAKDHKKDLQGFYFTADQNMADVHAGYIESRKDFGLATKAHMNIGKNSHYPNLIPVYISLQNPLIIDEESVDIIEDIGYWRNIYDAVKSKGHDGVMTEDLSQVFVFEPTQIKSSLGNNGDFDPNNPKINESL